MAYCVSSAATRRRPCRCRLTGAVRWKGWIRKRGIDSRVARSRVVVNRGGARRTAPGRHARRVLTGYIHGALRDRPHNFIKPFITPNSGMEGTDSCAINSKLRGCDSKRNHRCTTSPTPRGAARCGLCRGCLPSSHRDRFLRPVTPPSCVPSNMHDFVTTCSNVRVTSGQPSPPGA